jgi:tetratricopeptide (TPR) repeat protein
MKRISTSSLIPSTRLGSVRLLTLGLAIFSHLAWAQADPLALQQEAIKRIEGYIEHFRKTGDQQSRLGDLAQAADDLTASSQQFLQQGDEAAAALSLIKCGDALRIQSRADAAESYREGLRLAQKTNHRLNQVLALIGLGRTETNLLKDYGAAGPHFEEAVRLSESLSDRTPLFNALGGLGNVQFDKGELITAADTYNRCFTLIPALKDQSLALFAYLDRGEVYEKFAEKCDYEKSLERCYELLDLARKDYTAAQEVARKFEFSALAVMIQGLLDRLELRRRMYQDKERQPDKP